jgi:hypothetical protein
VLLNTGIKHIFIFFEIFSELIFYVIKFGCFCWHFVINMHNWAQNHVFICFRVQVVKVMTNICDHSLINYPTIVLLLY